MKKIRAFILFGIFVILFSACSITYTASELTQEAKKHFPIKRTYTKIVSFDVLLDKPYIKIINNTKRIDFKVHTEVKKGFLKFKGYVIVSGVPKLQSDTIFFNDLKVEKVVISNIPDWLAKIVIKKIIDNIQRLPIVPLSGIKAWLVDDVYIEERNLKISLSVW